MKNNYERRFGFHSIESILKNNPYKIKKLFIPQSRNDNRVQNIKILAEKNGIRYEISKKLKQDPEAYIQTENNLGFKDLKEFIKKSKNNNLLLLILDNVIDPRNLGACIRSAAVLNVDAIIINKHHCAPLNDIAHNVSAGGAELIETFYVSNLINCFKYLNEKNINIYGLSEDARKSYIDFTYSGPVAVVMGSEELGIRKKTQERCNFMIKLNDNKTFKSFNVSVATGIILSEILRQRNLIAK
ncbi:MAG: 23S rRNA (guanosine(2251)-2'-O)-methyltransferase RlmB [Gammaproteobacteria bacterium]|mgnify:FL=1|nr:23S rRNA (guanosine(2251)-2'-O)-methyltransferase RlmB [Gammaproteobacteria bacterium]|tara:strand:+ start:1362 stop:2090 length:729 start_codon:yes stop_codon:yes gene_type:complete